MSEICKLCVERGKTWNGSDPICGVDSNWLHNWNCATLNKLREIAHDFSCTDQAWIYHHEDQNQAFINTMFVEFENESFHTGLWMTWYKSRGATDNIYLLGPYNSPEIPTESELLQIINHYESY